MARLSLKSEKVLYGLLVLAALTLRVAALGHYPLSNAEARLALQALELAHHTNPALGARPGLTAITSLLFFLFGSTDALARLFPALVGGFLPLLAWPLRRRMGRLAALLFASALAFDPTLVALSRVANSPIPALMLGVGALLAVAYARWDYVVPLFVLGVLFGASFWFGMLGALVVAAVFRVFAPFDISRPRDFKSLLVGAFWALALGGTLAYWAPGVLGAAFNSFAAFVTPWKVLDAASAGEALFALAAYAPLAVGAALVGIPLALRADDNEHDTARILLIAALAMPILLVIYPYRPFGFLAWVVLPLWALGAWALARLPRLGTSSAVHAVLTFLLFTFSLLSLLGWSHTPPSSPQSAMRLALFGLTLLLILLATAMFAWGWTVREALGGLAWGAAAFGLLLNIAALSRAAYGPRSHELLYGNAAAPTVRLLQSTVADFGNWVHGRPDALPLVDTTSTPALAWDFHNLRSFTSVLLLAPDAKPEALITPIGAKPPRTAAYSGQDFRISARAPYPFSGLRAAVEWLAFREGETPTASAVLWIRTDLFPGAKK